MPESEETRELLAAQIETYTARRPMYVSYADVLKRVLEAACLRSVPAAVVQARAKTVSSFAEKCVRKRDKYRDPVNQLTDLCGARVMVQTLDQVTSVEHFIESHFVIHEKDDKTRSLGEERFGYRDLHFIASLPIDLCRELGVDVSDLRDAMKRDGRADWAAADAVQPDPLLALRAEVQVRTWLQHAWADVVHDRTYKSTLEVPANVQRLVALQAALMEEGDRNFNELAGTLDEMRSNYAAFAGPEAVDGEIAVQKLLLAMEPEAGRRAGHALEIARLHRAGGEYDAVISALEPLMGDSDRDADELSSELGLALCERYRSTPSSAEYARGVELLRGALAGEYERRPWVIDRPNSRGRTARAHHRLARALELMPTEGRAARAHFQKAHEIEADNPYHLTAMLRSEICATRERGMLVSMRGTLRQAVTACRSHALAGIELPFAYFHAGRLALMLDDTGGDESYEAFGYYARGIRHCLDPEQRVPPGLIEEETRWIQDLCGADGLAPASQWTLDLLALAKRVQELKGNEGGAGRRLIIAGGAGSLDEDMEARVRPLVAAALGGFEGEVVSGGTRSGVPGLAGEIAQDLEARSAKRFRLVGYLPPHLPHDAPKDDRYDEHILCGESTFSPEQLLRTWSDLLDSGVAPRDVLVLGLGGGPLSGTEYHLGLALGASVAVISGTGGAANALAGDPLWSVRNLWPVPFDVASVRALVAKPGHEFSEDVLERMARSVHDRYVSSSSSRLPENMRPWPELKDTFKTANLEQARYAVEILEAHGFGVREATSEGTLVLDRDDDEVQSMAEAEHGRWTVERIRDGWRFGPRRDDDARIHDLLVPWSDLPHEVREWDVQAVLNFPQMLRSAGLEVYRRDAGERS